MPVSKIPSGEKSPEKKSYCVQNGGDCEICCLVKYGRDGLQDCKNFLLTVDVRQAERIHERSVKRDAALNALDQNGGTDE